MKLCWRRRRGDSSSSNSSGGGGGGGGGDEDEDDGVRHVLVALRRDISHGELTPVSLPNAMMPLNEVLERIAAALQIAAADAIFFENGFRVVDAAYIRDGERLFVTCGRRSSLSRRSSFPPPPTPPTPPLKTPMKIAANMKKYALAVLGAPGVGKTALALCFVDHDESGGGGGSVHRKVAEVDGNSCIVEVAEMDAMHLAAAAMRRSQGFLLVMSVMSANTAADLQRWFDELVDTHTQHAPAVVLVANKIDVHVAHRQVFADEIRSIARKFNCPFVETSAKTGQNVDLAFHTLISLIEAKRECEAGAKAPLAIVQRPPARCCASKTPTGSICVLM